MPYTGSGSIGGVALRTPHLADAVLDRLERPLYFLKTNVARSPRLSLPLAWLQGRRELVDRDTDILIESFPRCASSFAKAAFRLAQEPREPRVASQTHAPGHVIAAVRLNVPALVLVRDPIDAVVSNLFRHPGRGVDGLLRGYLRFYEPLLPHRTGFVTATFEEVIEGGFGSVTRRINTRFGTDFVEFEATEENVQRCLRSIEHEWRAHRSQDEELLERTIPRPSEMRESLKESLRERVRESAPPRLRRRAESVYDQLAR
jgi:hypothetical protein